MPKNSIRNIKYIVSAVMMVVGVVTAGPRMAVAADCAEVEVLWARGSGESMSSGNYQDLAENLAVALSGVRYNLHEVEYPAVGIGGSLAETLTMIGAKISGGEALKFGRSVDAGVEAVKKRMKRVAQSCPETKFVLAGYSQGAMVMTKALREVNAAKVVYVANLGDPKLYLPEGSGAVPRACREGEAAYSEYRAYVPDCHAYEGILGGYRPYRPAEWSGKVGLWCNYNDVMCSARVDWENLMAAHLAYASDGRIEDVAKVIGQRVRRVLRGEVAETTRSTRDVAFLIDNTGSMEATIDQYKAEALRLAKRVVADGGRVALYTYADMRASDAVVKMGDFGMSLDEFKLAVEKISCGGGGDSPESLLGASMIALNELKWQVGANKYVVALTDAGFHNPEINGVTLQQVAVRAREIDPVHFYVVAPEETLAEYPELKDLTEVSGGGVYAVGEAGVLTEEVMNSTPEGMSFDDGRGEVRAEVENLRYMVQGSDVYLSYEGSGYRYLITVDEAALGFTDVEAVAVTDLEPGIYTISVTAYSVNGVRGETATVAVPVGLAVPGVPDTGVRI